MAKKKWAVAQHRPLSVSSIVDVLYRPPKWYSISPFGSIGKGVRQVPLRKMFNLFSQKVPDGTAKIRP